jgi:alkylated DNA repair protein (DNA oxidative demethylase)
MSVQSVCLGWHWEPYAYSRTADDTDGAPVKPMPPDLVATAGPDLHRHAARIG